MPADLHMHSNHSDGTYSPAQLVKAAKKGKLKTIALTDHDNVDGLHEALSEGAKEELFVIPGIEFSCETQGAEIHILGYFINYKDPPLNALLKDMKHSRHDRVIKMVEKLGKIGVDIYPERVFAIAGDGSPGRLHVAKALLEEKKIHYISEAFEKYIGFNGPAYVNHYKLSPEDAVKLIKKVNGLAVFAHPAVSKCDKIIASLVAAGLDGLEVFYPSHSEEQRRNYLNLCQKYNLFPTGGSDFHGEGVGRDYRLGEFYIEDEYVEKMCEVQGV